MVTILSHSPDETEVWGREFAVKLQPGTVIGMGGPVGAGKSVLTRGIARGLGIEGPVTSPTYTLITQYPEGRLPLYHMDLYRIDSEEEFEMTGGIDLLYSKGVSIIEWYEKVRSLLPEDLLEISVEIEENGDRKISLSREL